jgi:hypothetical protein
LGKIWGIPNRCAFGLCPCYSFCMSHTSVYFSFSICAGPFHQCYHFSAIGLRVRAFSSFTWKATIPPQTENTENATLTPSPCQPMRLRTNDNSVIQCLGSSAQGAIHLWLGDRPAHILLWNTTTGAVEGSLKGHGEGVSVTNARSVSCLSFCERCVASLFQIF